MPVILRSIPDVHPSWSKNQPCATTIERADGIHAWAGTKLGQVRKTSFNSVC
jgi:hypothetical protein